METIHYQFADLNTKPVAGRCNTLLTSCKNPECDYHYGGQEIMECPECETPREYCMQYPTKGREQCRYHGGNNARGLAHANHQGHGLSNSVPTRFLDKFQMYYQDPNLLNMTDDIALLSMRRDVLLEKLEQNSPADDQWRDLKEKFERLSYHMEMGHEKKIEEMMWALGHVINEGYSSVLIWDEIRKTIEEGRRVKDSEIKRIKTAQTIISEQQFDRVVGFIMSVIQNRVRDTDTLTAIMKDLDRLNI